MKLTLDTLVQVPSARVAQPSSSCRTVYQQVSVEPTQVEGRKTSKHLDERFSQGKFKPTRGDKVKEPGTPSNLHERQFEIFQRS